MAQGLLLSDFAISGSGGSASFICSTGRSLPKSLAFLLFIAVESIHFALVRLIGRRAFTLELLCYYLCGLNLLLWPQQHPIRFTSGWRQFSLAP